MNELLNKSLTKNNIKNYKEFIKKKFKKMECRKIIGSVPANALFAITLFITGLTIFTTLIVTVYDKLMSSKFLNYSFL